MIYQCLQRKRLAWKRTRRSRHTVVRAAVTLARLENAVEQFSVQEEDEEEIGQDGVE
jgi:hypothetical protein